MTTEIDLGAVREELLTLGTATLYEASGMDCFLPANLRPAWPGAAIVGRAVPVQVAPGDNLPIHLAVEAAVPGDVIVVDAAGSQHGYWGEVLTVAAQTRGIVGLVINGGVRDTRAIEAMDFPVFSVWIAIEGTLKDDEGTVGVPIRIGKPTVTRGDVVVADNDGIVSIPAGRFADVLDAARSRATKETEFVKRIRGGETTMDLYNLRTKE